ncbi:MAG: hypothetical protein ACK4GN_06435 [Runella sp.]
MAAALFETTSPSDLKILIELAQKLGIRTRLLSHAELEDYVIGEKIAKGMKGDTVGREKILKALE